MRALRWHGTRDVRLDDVPEPTPSAQADCIVAVRYCGICGTDVSEWREGPVMIWTRPHPLSAQAPPVTLGHELVGTLISGTSPDGSIAAGARVTVDACLRCGSCAACVRGDYNRCRYGGSIGLHSDGGFAPLVAVPGYTLVAVPDAVRDEQAALAEPFAVALHGLERAGTRPGSFVLVFGFGPIGAASALVARALGAEAHVVELDDQRRARARALGLTTHEPHDELPRAIRRLGDGGADVVVESTGNAAVMPVAIECATRGGSVALLGMPKSPSEIDTRRLTLFERSLVGSLGYRHDLSRVLAMVVAQSLAPEAIVSDTVALSGAADAIASLAHNPAGRIKLLVDTNA